ncbi:MAG: phage tail sheath family protein [bacterium]|nr:phage tail sheath family protein [bacterium]
MAIPDLHRAVTGPDFPSAQTRMLHHCALLGDRFALLDAPPGATAAEIESWTSGFDPRLAKNGALYFPWVTGAFEDARRQVPPCGFVAGLIADSDRRSGVAKAPANAALKGVVDLAAAVDREAQQRLNPAGVNCIRKFEDGQVRLFGARTLSGDPRFVYVNVRRTLLSVVKALSRSLAWAVFEPNDRWLRRRLESTVTGYLASLVAKGMTAGPRPQDSFYVKCDAENNPAASRDLGQVIAEIGLAIADPAEFIVLTARKSPESLSIVEEDV